MDGNVQYLRFRDFSVCLIGAIRVFSSIFIIFSLPKFSFQSSILSLLYVVKIILVLLGFSVVLLYFFFFKTNIFL